MTMALLSASRATGLRVQRGSQPVARLPCAASLALPARNARQQQCVPSQVTHLQPTAATSICAAALLNKRGPGRRAEHIDGVRCQSLAMDGAGRNSSAQYWVDKAILGSLFGGWYLANIVFNIYNKQALQAFPQPLTMTTLQFGVGSLLALSMWATGIVKRPQLSASTLKAVALLGLVHTLGNLLTNVSLGAVAVSFTHTIKAMEPFFSVLLSALFLGDVPSPAVIATLLPIVGGVALASVSEASFNWLGFLTAMGSNLTFQSRNVLSKKLMIKKDGSLDNISMFSLITIASFLILLPVSLAVEGWKLTPSGLKAMGVTNPNLVIQQSFIAALCFHTYQQVSYMILSRVSPVTHSIGNCVKRVVVICAAVVFFSNPVSVQNAAGTAIALGGVFAYGQVKRMQRKAKEEECVVKWEKEEECVVPDQTIDEPSG